MSSIILCLPASLIGNVLVPCEEHRDLSPSEGLVLESSETDNGLTGEKTYEINCVAGNEKVSTQLSEV